MTQKKEKLEVHYKEPTILKSGNCYKIYVTMNSLLLKLKSFGFTPYTGVNCEVEIAGSKKKRATDDAGLVRFPFVNNKGPGVLQAATESFPESLSLELVKEIAPVDTPEGQHLRLTGLGYLTYEDEELENQPSLCTIEEFQCDHGLSVDGICGPQTQAELVKQFGY